MQTVLPADFRRGQVLILENTPHIIEELHTTGTAKTKHKLHTRLRNLVNGHVHDRNFQDNEHVVTVEVQQKQVQYSYKQDDRYVFLDAQTFDEVVLTETQIGERHWFLRENDEYMALFLDGKLQDIVLPEHVVLKVEETAPAHRSTAQDSTGKEAKLEGGLTMIVPLFIGPGELIKVDTQTRKYAGKVSS